MEVYRVKNPSRAIEKTVGLAAKSGANLDEKVFIFCESRASLSYELSLCAKLGGSFNVSVMSFSRYVARRGKVDNYLGKTAATLVVRRIIEQNSDNLTRFKRGTANLAVNVYNVISQLKSAKVGVSELNEIVEKEKGMFGGKLKDIAFIYGEYEAFLHAGGYTDENSYLSLMPELLREDEDIRNAKVIVSGIGNLTKKTVDILLTLDKISSLSVVTVSADAVGYSNEIYHKILSLFSGCKVFDDEPMGAEQEALAKGLFDSSVFRKVGLYSDKVHIFEYPDAIAEAEAVAKRIRYEVVENGRRFKDFTIAAGNVSLYAPLFKRVFKDYDIPLYVDEKKNLSAHPLVGLFIDIIDVKRLNFKPQVCLSAVKNPLFCDEQYADAFENYLLKVTPSRRMMVKPFSDESAENARIILADVCNSIPQKSSVNEYIDLFLGVFKRLDVEDKTKKIAEKLAGLGENAIDEYSGLAIKAFIDVLNQSKAVAGGMHCDLELFKSLILSAVAATEVSLIASQYDCVFFGDTKTVPLRTADILFAVGFDSSVPDVRQDTSLLCDRELIRLEDYKCVIEPKLKIVNYRERESVLTTLTSFDKKLFVSYAGLGISGESNVKGDVIEWLENIFATDAKRVEAASNGESVFDYLSDKTAVKAAIKQMRDFSEKRADDTGLAACYSDYVKDNDKSAYKFINAYLTADDEVKTNLKYKGTISATLIETYFSCPYKAFGKSLLKLHELSTGDTAANEIGRIFHEVLQKFAPECEGLYGKDVESTALTIIEQVLSREEYARYLNKKQYEYIFALIKKELVSACTTVYEDLKQSNFKVLGTELHFSDIPGSAFRAINLNTVNGVKKVTGYIDRVDVYNDYVRVIDYKTGRDNKEKVTPKNLYAGQSVQLFLYLNAIAEKYRLAAAHYLEMTDAFVDEKSSNVNYYGKTLADDEIIKNLDTASNGGASGRYGIKRTKDGSLTSGSQVLDEQALNAYVKYAKLVTESGADEIYGGYFKPTPFTGGACKYCKLNGMCGYDCETGKVTRDLDKVTKDDLLAAVNIGGEENE